MNFRHNRLAFLVMIAGTPAFSEEPFGYDVPGLRPCVKRYEQGRLIVQQLRASKTCTASMVLKGATDCVFAAGKTKIRIVGVGAFDETRRATGLSGSGFQVEAVDTAHVVRAYMPIEQKRLVLEVNPRNLTDVGECVYDSAQLFLDGRVEGGGPWGDDQTDRATKQ